MSMTVDNGFDKILIKHYAYGISNRITIMRLLSIIDSIESIILDSKKNPIMQLLFKEIAQPLLKVLKFIILILNILFYLI